MKHRLSGRIHVALPAEAAFQLFTPRGEREWAPGWDPVFPAPTSDDSEPGTVFETDAHGRRGIWLVVDRIRGKRIMYAQVIPGDRAGSITVTLEETNGGREVDVEVVYELTPLSEAGAHHLKTFADGYGNYLESWQHAIAACLKKRVGI
jgi:hypothetical protein